MWIRFVLVLLMLISAPVASSAATVELEDALEHLIKRHDIPGMAVVVIDGDRIIESAAVGVRIRGSEDRVTLEDAWHLGSCTKAMTATLAARLVEQGHIQWDTTIAQMVPDVSTRIHPAYADVTLHELLTHRGGVPSEMLGTDAWKRAWSSEGTPHEQRQTFVADVLAMEPVGPRGSFSYSNAGYTVAGLMCA
ncbi:MAG: beta-lactamase family protein, partial [Phycisphaerales bacterium]|nr:beta-lactamase family protein [Phycisphaerales bacterium]